MRYCFVQIFNVKYYLLCLKKRRKITEQHLILLHHKFISEKEKQIRTEFLIFYLQQIHGTVSGLYNSSKIGCKSVRSSAMKRWAHKISQTTGLVFLFHLKKSLWNVLNPVSRFTVVNCHKWLYIHRMLIVVHRQLICF